MKNNWLKHLKNKYYLLGIVILVVIILVGFSKFEHGKKISNYDILIPKSINIIANPKKDTTLGTLNDNKVKIIIKEGAFDQEQTVKLQTPRSIPAQIGDQQLIGSPIEITTKETPVRLLEETTLTFQFDKSLISEDIDESQLRIGYHNGEKWEYVKPVEIDVEMGTMTLRTFHFSLFAPYISQKTKVTEQFIHSQALDNVIRENTNNESDFVTDQIVTMTLAKMGIVDEKIQKKIFDQIADAQEYKDIYNLYQNGDAEGAAQKTALLVGQKIAKNIPASMLKDALGEVVGAADDIAKVSQATGYAAEGQYKEAAKIIGEQIADKFLITTAGKIATQVIDGQINSWKNGEVDAAYQAYKNGADGYFWGYNVDKDDFDGVWDQMRGVRRQLELEAIKKENNIREEAGMPELTQREMGLVRKRVKIAYKKQFKQRSENEDAIAKEKEQLKLMFDAFDEARVLHVKGLDKGYTHEQKLELLNHFGQKIMRDTGRSQITKKYVPFSDSKISAKQIAMGAKIYFSVPDGKKEYKEYIKETFGVKMYPALEELKGSWGGTMTVEEVIISDEFRAQLEAGEGPQGCDSATLEDLKGKENPLIFTIQPTNETGGQFVMKDEDGEEKTFPFTYNDGKMEVSVIQDEYNSTISLEAQKKDDGLALDGSMSIKALGGLVVIKGGVGTTKQ